MSVEQQIYKPENADNRNGRTNGHAAFFTDSTMLQNEPSFGPPSPEPQGDQNQPDQNPQGQKPQDQKDKEDADKKKKEDSAHKKRFVWFIVALVIGCALLLIFGIIPRLRARPRLNQEAKKQSAQPPVQVAYPQAAPPITTIELPGNLEALQQTNINARASGFVRKWLVDIGDNVRAGQILAVLDTPDVEQEVAQARAQLTQAQAAVVEQRAQATQAFASVNEARQNARKQRAEIVQAQADLGLAWITYQRWNELAKQGAVSQQAADEKLAAYHNNQSNVSSLKAAADASYADIDAYVANYRSAVANVGAAQAQVTAAVANLRRNVVSQQFSEVRAPFAGVITARMIDQGVLIGGGPDTSGGGFTVASTSTSGGSSSLSSGASNSGSSSMSSSGGSRNLMYNSAADSATGGASSSGQPTDSSAATSTGGVPLSNNQTSSNGSSGSGSSGSSSSGSSGSSGSLGVPGSNLTAAGSVAEQNSAPRGGAPTGNAIGAAPQAGSTVSSTAPAARSAYGGSGSSDTSEGGTVASPGTSLYTLARIDIMRIDINVPQTFAPNIRTGQKAHILLREYPNRKFTATVTRTSRSIDPQARTMLVELQIRNREKLLIPGMYAQVVFEVPRSGQPLLVPSSALISDSRGTLLGTVNGNNKIHLVPVQIGRDYGQTIEIIGGLDPHALVVVNPSDQTAENAPARPVFASDTASGGGGGSGGGGKSNSQPQNSSGNNANSNNGSQGKQKPPLTAGSSSGGKQSSPSPNTGQSYGVSDQ